ncbi:Spore wall and anchoring disk complex protein EnP1 [Astathelohania contejeani]|uniref:Spore wall and anchoring disk complex protein EnP1 n=1 Tax=Astathelohania contejeani TaxID=164912 RepID=A0ABQ7I0R7_9MICR|nr:Spore wall and anchoring disk complex protein EnP1 [Thelohania contejeani]
MKCFTSSFLLTLLAFTNALNVVILKGRCFLDPRQICSEAGFEGVVANANNLPSLIGLLNKFNVPSAMVAGWNNHRDCYVLRANGALAPYDSLTNDTEYSFCVLPCPCPSAPVVIGSSAKSAWQAPPNIPAQQAPYNGPAQNIHSNGPSPCCMPQSARPQPPYQIPQQTTHRVPQNISRPSPPCYEEESDCYPPKQYTHQKDCMPFSNICHDKRRPCAPFRKNSCPIYVKRCRRGYRGAPSRYYGQNGDRLLATKDEIQTARTFVYNKNCMRNPYKVYLKEERISNGIRCKWVELKPLLRGQANYNHKNTTEHYPGKLRFPRLLLALKQCIEQRFRMPACLYIDKCDRLFTLVGRQMYYINLGRGVDYRSRRALRHMKLFPISKPLLNKMIQFGLNGITFDGSE